MTASTPRLFPCFCGCGGLTQRRFVPGHDARFHGRAKKVARGELDMNEQLALLPHDEAREAFEAHALKELPAAEALLAAREAKAQAKADAKAAKDAEKAAAAEDRTRLLAEAKAKREAAKTAPATTPVSEDAPVEEETLVA